MSTFIPSPRQERQFLLMTSSTLPTDHSPFTCCVSIRLLKKSNTYNTYTTWKMITIWIINTLIILYWTSMSSSTINSTHTVYMFSSNSLKRGWFLNGSKTSCRCNIAYTTCREKQNIKKLDHLSRKKGISAVRLILSCKLNFCCAHTSGFLGNAYVSIALMTSRTILKKSVYMWSSVDCKMIIPFYKKMKIQTMPITWWNNKGRIPYHLKSCLLQSDQIKLSEPYHFSTQLIWHT